jgi:hypothetical protein
MIQLWLKTGWWLRIGCIPSFYHVEVSRIELEMDDSFELTELGGDWELDAYPVFFIQKLWRNWVISEIGSRMPEYKFATGSLSVPQICSPVNWHSSRQDHTPESLSWYYIIFHVSHEVWCWMWYWTMYLSWEWSNTGRGSQQMYYSVKIFADTQLKFWYVCLFALCLKREETSHFLVGFGMQLWLEIWNQFLSDSSCNFEAAFL